MSRVHEALRRAEQMGVLQPPPAPTRTPLPDGYQPLDPGARTVAPAPPPPPAAPVHQLLPDGLLDQVEEVAFTPSVDRIFVNPNKPQEAPTEEFRSIRTRLNHLQTLQPLHNVVVTSPSPAEGKSFAAVNLALVEAQLEGNRTLLMDCDFRRPVIHTFFNMKRTPGITDYLSGRAELKDVIKRIGGTNLYVMPAGEAVINPLELLNLREVKVLLDELPSLFNWVILDSPPLLFAADASLLSTLCDGTVMVVRMGTTTIDSVTRAMQSLCQNNVIGTIVNGARRKELYSKYTYYHAYYTEGDNKKAEAAGSGSSGPAPVPPSE